MPRILVYRPILCAITCALLSGATGLCPDSWAKSGTEGDLSAARSLFEANLDAIRRRDREAYLACYLDESTLARTSPDGPLMGFASLARESAATPWPDLFEGEDLRLVPIRPGLVYGTYRYRVRYGDMEQSGLSERLFLKTPRGWRIAVTSAFPSPPGTPPPPRVLVGATLIDGTGAPPLPDSVVLLRGGTIECAGSRRQCPVPEGVGVLALAGQWITPGLIDAHVHFSQNGWAGGRPDALDLRAIYPYEKVQADLRDHPDRFFRSYLCSGVTGVFRRSSSAAPIAASTCATRSGFLTRAAIWNRYGSRWSGAPPARRSTSCSFTTSLW